MSWNYFKYSSDFTLNKIHFYYNYLLNIGTLCTHKLTLCSLGQNVTVELILTVGTMFLFKSVNCDRYKNNFIADDSK